MRTLAEFDFHVSIGCPWLLVLPSLAPHLSVDHAEDKSFSLRGKIWGKIFLNLLGWAIKPLASLGERRMVDPS